MIPKLELIPWDCLDVVPIQLRKCGLYRWVVLVLDISSSVLCVEMKFPLLYLGFLIVFSGHVSKFLCLIWSYINAMFI